MSGSQPEEPAGPAIRALRRLSRGAGAGRARGILRVWPLWERLARRIWPTVPVPDSPNGTFDVHIGRHGGREILLADGTRVRKGDWIVELHLNNRVLVPITRRGRWYVLPAIAGDLRALARWVERPDFPQDVRAVYGLTLIGRGAARLGFIHRDRPVNLQARLDRLFMTGLLSLYTIEGQNRFEHGKTWGAYPQEIWMSRSELLRRYGAGADGERPTERAGGAR